MANAGGPTRVDNAAPLGLLDGAMSAPASPSPAARLGSVLLAGGVALGVALAFTPALQNTFVDLDDQANVVDNVRFRGLGPTALVWMGTTFHLGHWQPLSWLTLGVDYLLWGLDPAGYHLTSVLWHVTNAVLLYLLARRLLALAGTAPGVTGPAAALGAQTAEP